MNLLVIFSDQQHKQALGKVNTDYITPNLDQLAEDGVLFENAYSPNPVCGPYRGCLMTGQYTSHCDVRYNSDAILPSNTQLAEVMKAAGYHTSYVGKYHLGGGGNMEAPKSQRKGFDHILAYQSYNGFNPNPPYNNQVIFNDENGVTHQFHEHRTDVTTKLSLEALAHLASEPEPFMMMVSYQAPHYPEQPSEKFAALYQDKVFSRSADCVDIDPYTPTFSPKSITPVENCPDYQNYGNNMQRYMQLYAGLCSQIDDGVGQIVTFLKENNLYEDTMIVYTSDHGDLQGSHGLLNKGEPYEQSCGVPMIVKYPGGRKNVRSKELVSGVDIFPTLVDAANSSCEAPLDGTSWIPYLTQQSEKTQEFIIAEYATKRSQWRMIRDRQYKLVTSLDYTPIQLFDMQQDPLELENIIHKKEAQDLIGDLLMTLREKTTDMNDRQEARRTLE